MVYVKGSGSWISDPWGSVWFSFWPLISGPALDPLQGLWGCVGIRVFCGLGEHVRLCPSRRSVRSAMGLWGTELRLYDWSQFVLHCWQQIRFITGESWTSPKQTQLQYLGVLFESEGIIEWELTRRISAASVVMWTLYWSVVVKELRQKRNSQFTCQPTVYSHPHLWSPEPKWVSSTGWRPLPWRSTSQIVVPEGGRVTPWNMLFFGMLN